MMRNATQMPNSYTYPHFDFYKSKMVVFWGASSEGHTYSLIGIDVSKKGNGTITHKKKVSYGAINADVVSNRISL